MGQDGEFEPYKIIESGGSGEIEEKKSRFIAHTAAVSTEGEAIAFIEEKRKRFWDARHNCFAYIIGGENRVSRSSDDGEPSGTAGRPMMEVLEGQGLQGVLAVVTRYFGGTLLGTGGLVRAYSTAVKEALADSVVLELLTGCKLRIVADYNGVGKLQYLVRSLALKELETNYADEVEMILLVPDEDISKVEKEVTEKTAGRARMERTSRVEYGVSGDGAVEYMKEIGEAE